MLQAARLFFKVILPKPVDPDELLRQLRRVLDASTV
jgi:hypothetical protein